MKPATRVLCLAFVVALGACKDAITAPLPDEIEIAMVPELATALTGATFTFNDGAFLDPAFKGGPVTFTFTSANSYRVQGSGKTVEGAIQYGSSASLKLAASSKVAFNPGGGGTPQNGILQNSLIWLGPNCATLSTCFPDAGVRLNNLDQTIIFSFSPAFSSNPLFGLFDRFDYQACLLGSTIRVGPYGTTTVGYSQGCTA